MSAVREREVAPQTMTSDGPLGRALGVAGFELRRLGRSLLVLLGLLLLVSGLALYSGSLHLRHQSTNAAEILAQHKDFVAKEKAKAVKRVASLKAANKPLSPDKKIYRNPAYLAQEGSPAVLSEGPLLLVSVGATPMQAQSTKVTLADPALSEGQENLQHPLQLWTGHFDLAFVLVYLLPLLLIALSFDLTAGEQASGNLKMLLVQGGGLQALIQGKLLARVLILTGMLLLVTAMAATTSYALGLPFAWSRWLPMLLAAGLYGLIWLGLAALLNALRWRAATIAATLAALWLFGVWVIPGTSQQLVQSLIPVPSRIAFVQSHREASEKVRQESSRLMGKYLEDHPELAGGADNRYATLQLSKEQALSAAIKPVVSDYQARLAQQQALARWLQYLSPVTIFESSLMQLAGSGPERQAEYRRQVAAFQGQWLGFYLPLIQQHRALMPADYDSPPHFSWREPRLSELAPALLPQLLFLAALAALLFGLALNRYRHYEVIESD